ncbi:hypothetical protein [Clostridium sp.]|uniref:hypothetical protein n=1 Tax=Clostridium sp. TaxID=1506 RepID=UPI003217E38B
MKKVIALVLTATIGLSLVGCGGNSSNDSEKVEQNSVEQGVNNNEVTYESFESLLNSFVNPEYYYNEINTIKLLSENDEAAYAEKAESELNKILEKESIDKTKAKIYPYYRNVNGKKDQVTYVITYDENNVVAKMYEVHSDISDDYEITFKEIKENVKIIEDKQFADLFKGEF